VVPVRRLEDLVETTCFFAKAGRPKGTGVAVASSSGGCGVMAADMAEAHGVALPSPGPAAHDVLRSHVPEYGSITNPVDFTGTVAGATGGPAACANALRADPQYSSLIVTTVTGDATSAKRQEQYYEPSRRHGKIICLCWVSSWADGTGVREIEAQPHIALFRSLDRCFAALAAWHARHRVLRTPYARPAPRVAPAAKEQAARLLFSAPGSVLTEREAKAALALYGIPVVPERLVTSAEEAARAAADLGFPVVLKVESADILHKTGAGVVRLSLVDAAGVREAYGAMMDKALSVTRSERIAGVQLQPMVSPGLEVMVGVCIDALFAPLVVVGLGGVLVELLADTAVGLAPGTRTEALAMLSRVKGARRLDGFRGGAAVDRERLAEIVCRVSEFAADHSHLLAEIDIDPVICAGDRFVVVDALIVKSGPQP
jgi:acyl-CoA synthetase (NDP forming)